MIIVRVELVSAITGRTTELARMRICNDGLGTTASGNYQGVTLRGRSAAALNRGVASRHGSLQSWPRQRRHVWAMVHAMLGAMGYGDVR